MSVLRSLLTTLPLVLVLLGPPSGRQEADAPEASALPSAAALTEQRDALRAAEGDAAEEDARQLDAALAALARAERARQRRDGFRADEQEAPRLAEELRAELAVPAPALPALDPGLGLAELERALGEAEAARKAALARKDGIDQELETRSARLAALPGKLVELRERLDEARKAAVAAVEEPAEAPRRIAAEAEVEALVAELAAAEAESDALTAQRELLPLRRDRARRQLTQSEEREAELHELVSARRQREAAEAERTAERQRAEATQRFPALGELAARNAELASLRSAAATDGKRAQRALDETRRLETSVERRYRSSRRRVEVGGITESVGLVLRRDLEWLRDLERRRVDEGVGEARLADAQLKLLVIEEQRDERPDDAAARDELLASLDVDEPPAALVQQADELLAAQTKLYGDLVGDLERLIARIEARLALEVELAGTVAAYRLFIEQRLLWVRSERLGTSSNPLTLPRRLSVLADEIDGAAARADLVHALRGRTPGGAALGVLLVVLVLARRRLRRSLARQAERVRSYRTDSFRWTVEALVASVLLALPVPLAIGAAGLALRGGATELVRAFGDALTDVGLLLLVFELVRQLASEHGVFVAHFRWPAAWTRRLRRELGWFEPAVLLPAALALTFGPRGEAPWIDALARPTFVVANALLGAFLWRVLRSRPDVDDGPPIPGPLGRLVPALGPGLPALLVVVALAGYTYGAFELAVRLRLSLVFLFGLVVVYGLLSRWLFVVRRRLAVDQARQRARARAEQDDPAVADVVLGEEEVDIPAVDAQTRQLFRSGLTLGAVVGLFLIWSAVLPALSRLDSIQVWPRLAVVDAGSEAPPAPAPPAAAPDAEPPAEATPAPSPQGAAAMPELPPPGAALDGATSLTLAELVLALVLLVLTWILSRNVPGLLEISILQRLPLDGGARYAAATIVRYTILIVGISAAFSSVGLGWDKIQWLAAALTFGLAFGLQEIFANFVSGVIILLERPVRVGDIVTVGTVQGRVTKLRMRATTVQDWDRRELLIPNKEFITGSLINWTLTDAVTRATIPVGVAYGSDTARTRALLLEAAHGNPNVLDDPPPRVVFRAFGESSLDFKLFVYLPTRDVFFDVIDDLHTKIDDRFREAGIEIAFPQRDLHLRSVDDAARGGLAGDPPAR